MAVSLQQPEIRLPEVLPDIGTSEAWERHRRKMQTQEKVAEIKRYLRKRSVWVKLVKRGYDVFPQINDREGVRVA